MFLNKLLVHYCTTFYYLLLFYYVILDYNIRSIVLFRKINTTSRKRGTAFPFKRAAAFPFTPSCLQYNFNWKKKTMMMILTRYTLPLIDKHVVAVHVLKCFRDYLVCFYRHCCRRHRRRHSAAFYFSL